jgi:hypothetical protein
MRRESFLRILNEGSVRVIDCFVIAFPLEVCKIMSSERCGLLCKERKKSPRNDESRRNVKGKCYK